MLVTGLFLTVKKFVATQVSTQTETEEQDVVRTIYYYPAFKAKEG